MVEMIPASHLESSDVARVDLDDGPVSPDFAHERDRDPRLSRRLVSSAQRAEGLLYVTIRRTSWWFRRPTATTSC